MRAVLALIAYIVVAILLTGAFIAFQQRPSARQTPPVISPMPVRPATPINGPRWNMVANDPDHDLRYPTFGRVTGFLDEAECDRARFQRGMELGSRTARWQAAWMDERAMIGRTWAGLWSCRPASPSGG